MTSQNKIVFIYLLVTAVIFACTTATVQGQGQYNLPTYSLDQCLEIAQLNNPALKNAGYAKDIANWNLTRSELARTPIVTGDMGYFLNLGKSIDPTTNDFVTQNIYNGTARLSASLELFNGMRTLNSIHSAQLNKKARDHSYQAAINNLNLSIANAYLQILLADEQLKLAQTQIEQSKRQLRLVEQRIQAGQLARIEALEAEALLANDELQEVIAENQQRIAYNELAALMNINPLSPFKIVRIETDGFVDQEVIHLTVEEIFNKALQSKDEYQALRYDLKVANKDISVAQGGYLPILSLVGNISTNYSSLKQTLDGTTPTGFDLTPLVTENFDLIYTPSFNYTKEKFGNQISSNFTQAVGLSMQIPIFNRGLNKQNVELARINFLQKRNALEDYILGLKKEIFLAVSNLTAAKNTFEALKKSEHFASKTYEAAVERYKLGLISTFELNLANSNLAKVRTERIQAKFDYIYKAKVVESYLSNEINLN